MDNRIKNALVSVYDKNGLVEFARGLSALGIQLISTGGTARMLRENSLKVREVSEITRFPEMLDGRVKTLHPSIHGALLADRGNVEHMKSLQTLGIDPIDLVVVNLYPFQAVAANATASPGELIENIDIGGVTLMRAAAKNFQDVAVVISPDDYAALFRELGENDGMLSRTTRLRLAERAFEAVTDYDAAILEEINGWTMNRPDEIVVRGTEEFRRSMVFRLEKVHTLRYGENPHQSAAVYRRTNMSRASLAQAEPLQGKELSFNNLLDLEAGWRLSGEFEKPTAVLIKHNNPCGVASAEDLLTAYRQAVDCDPVSAFGSVLAFNRTLEAELAEEIAKTFVEAIVAPAYSPQAREIFSRKKNLRLIELAAVSNSDRHRSSEPSFELRQIDGGFLVQTPDNTLLDEGSMKVVSRRAPNEGELDSLRFAWRVVKHVKSNAIVFARGGQTLGIGAGQMSRVDSVKIAVMKAQQPLVESVVASDAFFPFRDGVDEAARAGATAVIQPGGSVRDEEVVAAANEHDLAMIFTGIRHFRH